MNAAIDMVPGGRCDGLLLAVMDSPEKRLPGLWSLISDGHARGYLSPDAHAKLSQAIDTRCETFRVRRQLGLHRLRQPAAPVFDRPTRHSQARKKRRVWSGSGALPHDLRHNFTHGEQAVAAVVRHEIARNGCCKLSHAGIAKRAGLLGTTVVKRFMRLARKLGMIHVQWRSVKGGKHQPNIVTLNLDSVSGNGRKWQWWINYEAKGQGPRGHEGVPCKSPKLEYLSEYAKPAPAAPVERVQRGYEKECATNGSTKMHRGLRR